MNFVETTKEVLNWMGSHPIDDVLCGFAIAFAAVGGTMKYKEHREERREVEKILARAPHPKPIKFPPAEVRPR